MYPGPFAQFSPTDLQPVFLPSDVLPRVCGAEFRPRVQFGFHAFDWSVPGLFPGPVPAPVPGWVSGTVPRHHGRIPSVKADGALSFLRQVTDLGRRTPLRTGPLPPQAAGFTPYSYNQPFFPGYSGARHRAPSIRTPGTRALVRPRSPISAVVRTDSPLSPASFLHTSRSGCSPHSRPRRSGTLAPTPPPTGRGSRPSVQPGVGQCLGRSRRFSGFPVTNSYSNGTYQSGGYLGGGFSLPTYNGYATFPSNPPTAPGFPAWKSGRGRVSLVGDAGPVPGYPGANPFASGPFGPGAGGTGWFPGQATFPWYSQVNGLPYTPTAAAPSTRPGENTDGTSANQQPRGIQFNRDAA